MPIGKDIYKQMGKRFGERHERMEQLGKQGPEIPAEVQQSKKNQLSRSRSINVHITELTGSPRRQISPTEGKPAINGKADEETIKRAVTKVRPKGPKQPRAGEAAIKPKGVTKKCSVCRKPGHTKRNCPSK